MVDIAPSHRTRIQPLTGGLSLHDVEIFLDLAFILRIQRYLFSLQGYIMDATGMFILGTDYQVVYSLLLILLTEEYERARQRCKCNCI